MPIPVSTTQSERVLLRDVVFDSVVDAIADGVIEFGERLHDDQLMNWLRVSRTPVREAITRLAEHGIVTVEANRSTRVMNPSVDDFIEANWTACQLWATICTRAMPLLDDETAEKVIEQVRLRAELMRQRSPRAHRHLFRMMRLLASAVSSPLLTRVDTTVTLHTVLMFERIARSDRYPWLEDDDDGEGFCRFVRERDGEGAARLFTADYPAVREYHEWLRTADVFPASARPESRVPASSAVGSPAGRIVARLFDRAVSPGYSDERSLPA